MGDFRKKNSCRLFSGKKFFARKYVAKKIPTLKKYLSYIAYNAGKKNLTQFYVRRKILSSEPSHSYQPQKVKWSAPIKVIFKWRIYII